MDLEQKLRQLPGSPGVYLMYDKSGQVIYVGKAVSLKNRVRQYFNNSVKLPKVKAMVDNIADFGFILTLSEKDALSLEANLVKKYYPRYNVLLKDDKHSPYIKIDLKPDFPRIEVTRKIKKDGAKYFGPYFNGIRVYDIVDIIKQAYNIRTCPNKMPKKECLHYHIKTCSAPCSGKISKQQYNKNVDDVIAFLSGKDNKAEELLNQKMQNAVSQERFEQAIECRNRLSMLKQLKERNIEGASALLDTDAIAYAFDGMFGAIAVNIIRAGKMMGVKTYSLTDASMTIEDSISSFITQYYLDSGSGQKDIPMQILLNINFDTNALSQYLCSLKGGTVNIVFPQKGLKKKLVLMAEKNAQQHLIDSSQRLKQKHEMTVGAVDKLKCILDINSAKRIECYDISNISGTDKVASGVVFLDGEPSKKDYRRYKIKTVEGADDYACLKETLLRRLNGQTPPPDLFVIDGGKGQLNAVADIIVKSCNTPVVALAEKEELVYTLNSPNPIVLSKNDYALMLLIRIRDEAHRFALSYHHLLRNRRLDSQLSSIKGVGKSTIKKLYQALSLSEIKLLDSSKLAEKAKISIAAAKNIEEYFKNNDLQK